MKTAFVFFLTLVLVAGISGCVSASTEDNLLLGRYAPTGLDARATLTLFKKSVFLADWWILDPRNNKVYSGEFSGVWKTKRGRIILHFDTKEQKNCVCEFRAEEVGGRSALVVIRSTGFPLFNFVGSKHLKEDQVNQSSASVLEKQK